VTGRDRFAAALRFAETDRPPHLEHMFGLTVEAFVSSARAIPSLPVCRCGVDLELFFVTPARPLVESGEWGWAYREFACDQAAWEQSGQLADDPALRGHSCLPVHPAVPQGEERGRFVRVVQAAKRPYLAVLFPRLTQQAMPRRRAWAGRDGFELTATGRRDWRFLAAEERAFDDDERGFVGRAGAIRQAAGATELILLEGRRVWYKDMAVEGAGLVSITAKDGRIAGQTNGAARTLTPRLPAQRAAASRRVLLDNNPVRARRYGKRLLLKPPAGFHRFAIGE
jgi:hypothetical protein